MRAATIICLFLAGVAAKKESMVWTREQDIANGYKPKIVSPLPDTYVKTSDLPTTFTWGNINGTSYLTKSLNQHIPQYCGSCWAHGAISSLGDRIKIARKAKGIDVNLAVQHVLNCGNAGSCHGGSALSTFKWIEGNADGVVYDTCNAYVACSSESQEGFCPEIDTTCKAENICRTCSTFTASGGYCQGVSKFPNATVAEHGPVVGDDAIMKEIYARGPIACGVDSEPLHTYHGGIFSGKCGGIDHIISVVGWGSENGKNYWIVRNSWGQFWGELGYVRLERGDGNDLCLNQACSWATPKTWTEHNYPCNEDASNCVPSNGKYVDPSAQRVPLGARDF